jgi:hypothetical protein
LSSNAFESIPMVSRIVDYEPPAVGGPPTLPPVTQLKRRRVPAPLPPPAPSAEARTQIQAAATFADAALRRVLEVIDRRRPLTQLRPLMASGLVETLLSGAGRHSAAEVARLRRVRAQVTGPGGLKLDFTQVKQVQDAREPVFRAERPLGHGLDSVIANTWSETERFFDAPRSTRTAIRRTEQNPLGWFDRELTKRVRDHKEVFDFVDPSVGEAMNRWPELPGFRDGMVQHFEAMSDLAHRTTVLLHSILNLGPSSSSALIWKSRSRATKTPSNWRSQSSTFRWRCEHHVAYGPDRIV